MVDVVEVVEVGGKKVAEEAATATEGVGGQGRGWTHVRHGEVEIIAVRCHKPVARSGLCEVSTRPIDGAIRCRALERIGLTQSRVRAGRFQRRQWAGWYGNWQCERRRELGVKLVKSRTARAKASTCNIQDRQPCPIPPASP